MRKMFLTFLVMVGTVVGSGFLSGKEIAVFFSRFGLFSFPCIFLAFFLFWGLFWFMLTHGSKAVERLKNSKFSNLLNIFICIVLAGAMFGGSFELTSVGPAFLPYIFLFILVVACFWIIKNGLGSLEKANLVLVPIMLLVLLVGQFMLAGGGVLDASFAAPNLAGLYYSAMYVVLNTSNAGVVIAHMGKDLSKKQKARVSFLSALVLCVILLISNYILLKNPECHGEDMPLLSLFEGGQRIIMQIVILFGSVTTLFSVVFALSSSLRGLCKNERCANALSVFLPLVLSILGFGKIVTYLYPISSVLGIFLICDLFLLPFFKQTYKAIHPARDKTK